MEDIRQSSLYSKFMESLWWNVEKIDRCSFSYIRRFPLIGSFIKIQKISPPIPFIKIDKIRRKYNAYKIQIAPNVLVNDIKLEKKFLSHGYRIDRAPNIPTKTIQIDLKPNEDIIFSRFSEAKRRAVRRALKLGVVVKESEDIDTFISIRTQHFFPFGFFMKKEMQSLWKVFHKTNSILLLANNKTGEPVSGILLLFYKNTSYYWYAASIDEGKKLFAPTLLVWEALKVMKKRGSISFDFEGVYDERFRHATVSWKGFTKFKEGFGGRTVEYMPNYCK